MWKWIDAHETELGIGRPYLDRDPPHVGPVDGQEYADKRKHIKAQTASSPAKSASEVGLETKKRQLAAHEDDAGAKAKGGKIIQEEAASPTRLNDTEITNIEE
jgi:hypothetical protein